MLREALGRGAGEPGTGPGGGPVGAVARRARAAASGTPGLIRRNRLFSAALALAVIPRIVSMLGYQPAVLFKLDSYDYLWNATHLQPDPVNTSGYSVFLWLLWPFHSLALVVAIQHLLGLGMAVLMYAVLRRWNVRRWVATLATVPVLFMASEMFAEQLIMADFLALALMVAGYAVLLWDRRPTTRQCIVAGLLMAGSVLVRPTTLPLIVLMIVYVLIRRAGWRRAGVLLVAGAVPIIAYMGWFAASAGSFNLTNSNGLFLWSRTMSFANCSVIKPPADLVALCPGKQPGYLNQPLSVRMAEKVVQPKNYLWDHSAWMWRGKPLTVDGVRPDVAAFTAVNNTRAQRFAIKAIEAEPLSYLQVVAHDTIRPFVTGDTFVFQLGQSHTSSLDAADRPYALAAVHAYVPAYPDNPSQTWFLGHHLGARLVSPWAALVRGYQRLFNLPGWVLDLIVLGGLAGIVLPRTRSWPAALLWISAIVVLIVPTAEHDFAYRYALPAIPLFCLAAALCFGVARGGQASGASAQPAAAAADQPVAADKAAAADSAGVNDPCGD